MESAKARIVSSIPASEAEGKNRSETPAMAIELLENVAIMARHALETRVLPEPRILERVSELQAKIQKTALDGADIAELTTQHEQLTKLLGKVTATSLRATSPLNKGYWSSVAGRHLLRLWGLTGCVALLIFLYSMLGYRVSYFTLAESEMLTDSHLFWIRLQQYCNFLIPFTYGALGACAYLLRVVETKLKRREFDPERIPQHWNRLVLGTLSGGMVVMFVNQMPGVENTPILISEGALGFLAGYSIDFLFQTLDRLITAILPKSSSEAASRRRE